jgi:large subunit ribosomal protein L21
MEAIIRDGGRQLKVKEGMSVEVDYRKLEPGTTIEFAEVLCVSQEGQPPRLGTPTLNGAKVIAKVLGKTRGPKLIAAQFRRRKDSRRRVGHRQTYTQVQIQKIEA